MKVTGLNIIEEMVNGMELTRKIEKDVYNDKVNQLVAQGVEREIAKVMVKAFDSCGIA